MARYIHPRVPVSADSEAETWRRVRSQPDIEHCAHQRV